MSEPLIALLLAYFPTHTHALTLVADPDHLLRQIVLAGALTTAGFHIVDAGDPLALRRDWYAAQPLTPEHPLIVVTVDAVNKLPYDIWQQGVTVDLAVQRFFPHLDGSLLARLTLAQLDRIYQAQQTQPPASSRTQVATLAYVLLHVFDVTTAQLATPAGLLRWLAAMHSTGEVLPAHLCSALLPIVQRHTPIDTWPLARMLVDSAVFYTFVQEQWQGYVRSIADPTVPYTTAIPFASDPTLRAVVSVLAGAGALTPVAVAETASFPAWSVAGVRHDAALGRLNRWNATLAAIEQLLGDGPANWEAWRTIAGHWADLTVQRHADTDLPDPACASQYASLAARVAPPYAAWLIPGYRQLANRRLPVPHHLHHVPGLLARNIAGDGRVALVVLDGMRLAAWRAIWSTWALRYPTWRAVESLVLAQVPTITAISRQALLAGKPPRAFADSL